MENDEVVAKRLLALAIGPDRRSKSGRLRILLPTIETALEAGLSLEVILAELNSQGLDMKLGSFKSTLYRIRQEKPAAKMKTVPAAAPPANPTPIREVSSASTEQAEDKPEETSENSERLTAKQRRERLADQFITPQSSNPLLNRIKKESKP